MLSKRELSIALILILALLIPGLIDRALLLLSALLLVIVGRLHSNSGAEESGE